MLNNGSLELAAKFSEIDFKVYTTPVTISCLILAILGIFGNFAIITLTICSKNLKSTCFMFFAVLALFDLLGCISFVQRLVLMGVADISQYDCFISQLYALCSASMSMAFMITITVDRLLAIKRPILYKRIQTRSPLKAFLLYMFAQMLTPIFGLILGVIFTLYPALAEPYKSEMKSRIIPMCFLSWSIHPLHAMKLFLCNSRGTASLNLTTLVLNAWLFYELRKKRTDTSFKKASTAAVNERRLQRRTNESILITVLAHLFGYTFAILVIVVISAAPFESSLSVQFHIILHISLFALFNNACNFYIYYWRIEVYRQEFARIFLRRAAKHPTPKGAVANAAEIELKLTPRKSSRVTIESF